MPTPEVQEDFPVCTGAGKLLGGQKGRRPYPMIRMDMDQEASLVGSIVEKS